MFGKGPEAVVGGVDEPVAIAARNAERLPHGDGWRSVAAPGPYGALVGESVDDLDVTEGSRRRWSVDQADLLEAVQPGGVVPLILTGEIEGRGPPGVLAARRRERHRRRRRRCSR